MTHSIIVTLLLAALGGTAFQLAHIPLSWLLGPMTALLVWREGFRRRAAWPAGIRSAGLVLLGYMIGGTFTAEVALQIVQQLPAMALATLLTVAFAMGTGWLTARKAGISVSSALIGSIPGGLSQMVALSSEIRNADMTVVTFMQTIRLMSVIFIVPFLAIHGLGSPGPDNATSPGSAAIVQSTTAAAAQVIQLSASPEAASAAQQPASADTRQGAESMSQPERAPADASSSISADGPDAAESGVFADHQRTPSGSAYPVDAGAAAGSLPAAAGGVKSAAAPAETGSPWLSLNVLWYGLAVVGLTWLAPRIHLPTPYLLGPMLAAAVLCLWGLEAPKLPGPVIIGAQIMVGAHMGVNTSLSSLANWRKLLPYALLGGVGIVMFSLGVGYMLTLWHPMSFATAFLGAAPGGMTEMGLTGAAVHADLSVIVAYQMFRILFILFLVPYMVKGLLRAAAVRA